MITRALLNETTKKMKTFLPAIEMRNGLYYWMNSEGLVCEIPWCGHDEFAYRALVRLKWDGVEDVDTFFYSKGWIRIGVEAWRVDCWPARVNNKQRRAIADWCALDPQRKTNV